MSCQPSIYEIKDGDTPDIAEQFLEDDGITPVPLPPTSVITLVLTKVSPNPESTPVQTFAGSLVDPTGLLGTVTYRLLTATTTLPNGQKAASRFEFEYKAVDVGSLLQITAPSAARGLIIINPSGET